MSFSRFRLMSKDAVLNCSKKCAYSGLNEVLYVFVLLFVLKLQNFAKFQPFKSQNQPKRVKFLGYPSEMIPTILKNVV